MKYKCTKFQLSLISHNDPHTQLETFQNPSEIQMQTEGRNGHLYTKLYIKVLLV